MGPVGRSGEPAKKNSWGGSDFFLRKIGGAWYGQKNNFGGGRGRQIKKFAGGPNFLENNLGGVHLFLSVGQRETPKSNGGSDTNF
jgi:hypothetical protein